MGRSSSEESSNSRSRSTERGRPKHHKKEKKKDKKDKRDRDRRSDRRGHSELAAGGAGNTPPPQSTALALPEDNTTVDAALINSLCRSVNEMTQAVAKMSIGMDKVHAELTAQKIQVQAVVQQLEKLNHDTTEKMSKFEDEMNDLNKDIDKRLAEMSKKQFAPAPTYSAAAASASSSGSGPPAVGPGGPAASKGGAFRPCRIWLKGFRETLTTKYLNNYANTVITNLPVALRPGARAGAPGFGAVVYIDFPAGTDMVQVKKAIQDQDLKHTDANNTVHKLRTAPDVPLAVRHRGRVLGELWKLVLPHLEAQEDMTDVKLGNSNGRLFIVSGDRPTELFAAVADDSGLAINPHEKNLEKLKIPLALAASWILQ
jgi:hypothetical protein